jgi:hypothetical protein
MTDVTKMMENKKKEQESLTNKDIEWLRKQKMLFDTRKLDRKEKAVRRTQYWRFRNKILRTIEILSEASKLLPENQKKQVLTSESIEPLIKALLTYEPEEKSKVVKNKRVFEIIWMLREEVESAGLNVIKKPFFDALVVTGPAGSHGSRLFEAIGYVRTFSRLEQASSG